MAYAKHTWQTGETITATKLNNIENGIATNDEAIGTIPETIAEMQTELESKANVDGVYETMTVGNAEQLVSTQFVEDNAPYVFRTSGGSADIGNREEDTIVGGTVAWNQMVQNGNFADSTGWTGGGSATLSVADNVATLTFESGAKPRTAQALTVWGVSGHKYLFSADVKSSIDNFYSRIGFGASAGGGQNSLAIYASTAYAKKTGILALSTNSDMKYFFIGIPNAEETTASASGTLDIKNVQLFDLTQMFGAAVADAVYAMEQANAGSGVAWFKAQYPLDYYAYNTGELKSVEGLASHDMVGFNQWDEEWELGSLNTSNGTNVSVTNRIRSKNFIPVLPSTDYYFKAPYQLILCQYDSNKNFIRSSWPNNQAVTLAENTRFIRFASNTDATTYNNDICINLSWSGTRNGEYEPYVKRSYPLDSTLTLRGIPKVDADGQMYYDGDTYEADGTVTRKYGVVDLGSLTWQMSESTGLFVSTTNSSLGVMPDLKNAICQKYTFNGSANSTTTSSMAEALSDKQMCAYSNATNANKFIIKDSAYSDATALTTALNGVMLVYELETPTTETADPFTTPQVVEDWGTEEYVTTGIVAVGHNTKYPQNLRDKLQHLPVLAEDDGAYLIQQTGTQMHLVNFRIPKAEDLADGTYVLKATVSGGTPTYTWEAES